MEPSDLMPNEPNRQPLAPIGNEHIVAGAHAREVALVAAAFAQAQRFPRNRATIVGEIQEVCRSHEFADKAIYTFPRGTETVEGPGIKLVREVAKLWGRIWHSVELIRSDETTIKLRAQAIDLERMQVASFDAEFAPLVQRSVFETRNGKRVKTGTEWRQCDERDRRELIGRQASIALRRVLSDMIPFDVLKLAEKTCKATCAATEKKMTEREYATWLVGGFKVAGVSAERVEARLGKSIFEASRDELLELNEVRKRIENDEADAADEFPVPGAPRVEPKPDPSAGARDALANAARQATNPHPNPVTGDGQPTTPTESAKGDTEATGNGTNGSARSTADVARDLAQTTPKSESPKTEPTKPVPTMNAKARAAVIQYVRDQMKEHDAVAGIVDDSLRGAGVDRLEQLQDAQLAKLHAETKAAVESAHRDTKR